MIRKFFETILYLLSFVVLQHFSVLGCQTNRDCPTQTSRGLTQCCHNVVPPRCMEWMICYLRRKDNTQLSPTFFPTFKVPVYPKFTYPDYNKFTVPDYKFTHPDFNLLTEPNINIPNPDVPTFSYDDNNDDYYDATDHTSKFSPGALVAAVVALILLTLVMFWIRRVRYRPTINHLRQNCNMQPPAATSTSRTNLATNHTQQNEEPSRIVIIAVTRDEDHIRRQNRPPDGEPPFLNEEDILRNLHNSCAQEPPPYEETAEGPHLPKYEDLVNAANGQPPPPAYPEVQATSRSSMNPSQITHPIQQNLPIPNASPPSYEEAQAATNEVADPLP